MSDPCQNKDMAALTIEDADRIELYRRENRITSLRQFAIFIARSEKEVTVIKSAIQRAIAYGETRIAADLKRRIERQLRQRVRADKDGRS